MSEGVDASRNDASTGSRIRNARDFYGGLALAVLAIFALWASRDLPGMHGFAFGPGTAPRLFSVILLVLGVAVSAVGLLTEGPGLERYAVRGPVFVTASVVVFAVLIRHLGLVIATYVSILVAALGTAETRWVETAIWAAVLTAFCALLFPYGLNLPIPLWPQNLTWSTIFSIR